MALRLERVLKEPARFCFDEGYRSDPMKNVYVVSLSRIQTVHLLGWEVLQKSLVPLNWAECLGF